MNMLNWLKELNEAYKKNVSLNEAKPFWHGLKPFPQAPLGSDLEDPNAPPQRTKKEVVRGALKKLEPYFMEKLPQTPEGGYEKYDHDNKRHRGIFKRWWKGKIKEHGLIEPVWGAEHFEQIADELIDIENEHIDRLADQASHDADPR